jgi:hypothetical protein
MFKFTNNTFHVTRGDKGSITIAYADGAELPGTICFRVYEKDGLDSKPIINKEIEIDDNLTSYELVLTSEDTYKFDNPSGSDKEEYWYELKLGPDNTVLGCDERGPKIFYIYPTGKDGE